jgi:hypothetical protein
VELLELACRGGSGATTGESIASLLTNEIHNSTWRNFSDSTLFFRPDAVFVYNPTTVWTSFAVPETQTYDLAQYLRALGTVTGIQQCNDVSNFLALNAQALGVGLQPLFIQAIGGTSLTTPQVYAAGTDVKRRYVAFVFHQIGTLNGFVWDSAVSESQVHAPFSGETLGGYLTKAFPGAATATVTVTTLNIGNVAVTGLNPFTVERVIGGTLSVSGSAGSSATVTVQVFNPAGIDEAFLTPILTGGSLSNPTVTVLGTATTTTGRGTVSFRFNVGGTLSPGPLRLQIETLRGTDRIIFDVTP